MVLRAQRRSVANRCGELLPGAGLGNEETEVTGYLAVVWSIKNYHENYHDSRRRNIHCLHVETYRREDRDIKFVGLDLEKNINACLTMTELGALATYF